MKQILDQVPHKIEAALAAAVSTGEQITNILRWLFCAFFFIAGLWTWNDEPAVKFIYFGIAFLWLVAAFVFGMRSKSNLGNGQIFSVFIDLAVISAGLILCAWQEVFINKGTIVFLCYFPVLALTARRNNILLIAQSTIFIVIFYVLLNLVTINSFPLLRVLAVLLMSFVAAALTRKPKKELVQAANEAVKTAYELGARDKDTELTALVHAQLMPPVQYTLPGLYATYKHAVGTITSGDYYQIFDTPRGHVVFLADLPGQGVVAALTVAQLQQQFAEIVKLKNSLPEMAAALNTLLWQKFQGQQTMSCVLAHWQGAQLHYLNAGHLPGLHFSKREIFSVAMNNENRLGNVAEASFAETIIDFPKGDMLLLYTDGTYLGLATEREQGIAQIERLANEFNGGEVNTICHRVFDCGQPEYKRATDDSTVVMVRRQEFAGEATA